MLAACALFDAADADAAAPPPIHPPPTRPPATCTVAGIIDATVFHGQQAIKKKLELGKLH